MNLTVYQWVIISLSTLILGMGKAGLKGIEMINVVLMALVFGSKQSTGIVLPLLCIADIMAVWYYKRSVHKHHIKKLIGWIVLGILIGVFFGNEMPEKVFKKTMALIVIVAIAILIYSEILKKNINVDHIVFPPTMGIITGFTTMIGNLAGTFANIYFLSFRLEKINFIGTAAFLFLIINFFKLPFQIFYWQNITTSSLKIDLLLIPSLLIGFWIGLNLVGRFSETFYRKFVIFFTLLGALFMLLK